MIRRKKHNSGFTLTEMVITLAIIAVLLGLAIPGIVSYSRRMRLTSLDDSAHSIFVAAQSHLSAMKSAGEDLGGLVDGEEIAVPRDPSVSATGKYYALTEAGKAALLPFGSIDPQLAAENSVIEIDPRSGAVYAVWYWQKSGDFEYATQAYRESGAMPDPEVRLTNRVMVGYYGGTEIDRPKIKQIPSPQVELIKEGDEVLLNVSVRTPVPAVIGKHMLLTVTLTGKTTGNVCTIVEDIPLYRDRDLYKGSLVLDTKENYHYSKSDGFLFEKKTGQSFEDWMKGFGRHPIDRDEIFSAEVKVAVADETSLTYTEDTTFLPQYVTLPEISL